MSPADSSPSPSILPLLLFYGGVLGLAAVAVAVLLSLFTPIPLWVVLILGILGAVGYTVVRFNNVDQIVLDHLDVVDADEKIHARIFNLLESLSLSSGVPSPDLYLTDDPSVNAAAVQRGTDAAAVVTAGAVTHLDRLELEGLLAEVIIRIANGDARASTVSAAMIGLPFSTGPLSFLSPLAHKVMTAVLVPDRELIGDVASVRLTRYPQALANVLERSTGLIDTPPTQSDAGSAHLWVVPPSPYHGRYDAAVRIAALNEF
ncbi:MAG: hypothetical protein HKN03_09775 [Acidimicrobiales bacterium]|nr:hypothetical protein [Acidimicrobiales bacterium]